MTKAIYGPGDIVVLNDGPLRYARGASEFRILAVMPESDGQVQYRARADVEGFERRISAGEIDVEKSIASKHVRPVQSSKIGAPEPWFKPASIKTRK
ncbi:MAG: cold-shock protein [Rhizobium sp.]|nr:cold-shock protein [Rhizobium sp.]